MNYQNFNKTRMSLNFKKILELLVLFLFYNVYKEKMFTIKIEDGREAPSKPRIIKILWILYVTILYHILVFLDCDLKKTIKQYSDILQNYNAQNFNVKK